MGSSMDEDVTAREGKERTLTHYLNNSYPGSGPLPEHRCQHNLAKEEISTYLETRRADFAVVWTRGLPTFGIGCKSTSGPGASDRLMVTAEVEKPEAKQKQEEKTIKVFGNGRGFITWSSKFAGHMLKLNSWLMANAACDRTSEANLEFCSLSRCTIAPGHVSHC